MALKFGPALLVLTGFLAIVLGSIFRATTIDEDIYRYPPAKTFDDNVIIGDRPTDLVWFLQVSDLHLSNRGSFERISDFEEFANTYADIFKPDAVLVTGDITDGKANGSVFATDQQIDEWQAYHRAVTNSKVTQKTAWLDVRGNHDNFNVFRPSDSKSFYRIYSVRGKDHERNYHYILEKGGKNYSFFGVDEVQTPGLKIPFNFLGLVDHMDLDELAKFKEYSQANQSQYNVWFAHYPSSSLHSPNDGLRHLIDGPYLCGHYHTIGNMVMKMQVSQESGYVELELGDWKYNRLIRLGAIDNQLFSIVDFKYKQFPIALMTNPKGAEYVMPKYEPVGRIANSTHIRILAFSNVTISKVEVSIDDGIASELTQKDGPLYVIPWNPDKYSYGLHRATILVTDIEGKKGTFNQTFSLDNSKEDWSIFAKFLLRLYFRTSVMTLFYFAVCMCILPLIILKYVKFNHRPGAVYRGYTFNNIQLLSSVRRLLIPMVLIPLWVCAGPIFVGYMVDDAIGICFIWGIIIDGKFIHTGLTFNVGSLFLLTVHIPELILLSSQVGSAYKFIMEKNTTRSIHNLRIYVHVMVTMIQLAMSSLIHGAYGTMALLTSFPFIWCIFIYAYCWYQCTTLKKADFPGLPVSESQEEQPLTSSQSSTSSEMRSNERSKRAQ